MEIRKSKAIEAYERELVCSIAFEYSITPAESPEAYLEKLLKEQPDIRLEDHYVAVEDGRIIANLQLPRYEASFDGGIYGMWGIGAVATLPQYRKGGSIRKIFEVALKEMYDEGQLFSYLYPFRSDFYRKFGYELGAYLSTYTYQSANCRALPQTGSVRQAQTDADWENIKCIYNEYICDKNMAVSRNEANWAGKRKQTPEKDRTYAYIWHNDAGKAQGYMVTRHSPWENGKRILTAAEFCFTTAESFHGLLAFSGVFSSDYTHFRFTVPAGLNIRHLLTENTSTEVTTSTYGMSRVVNVQKVLEVAKYKGDGSFTVAVKDAHIAQNNGTYNVTFGKNGTSVTKTDAPADLECEINMFTALITGALNFEDARFYPQIKVHGNCENLSKAFYSKHNFIADYF